MSGGEGVLAIREPSDDSERCYAKVAALLSTHLPFAHVEHIGSTSVPGCVGKGDVDLLVRVSPAEFGRAREILDWLLARSTRNDATESYAEYDWAGAEQEAGVHLVAAGGTHDDFHRFKALLLADPILVQRYNALKLRYDGRGMGDYRQAKDEFITDLLSAAPAADPDAAQE